MIVLVTGAGGFIGSHLTERLLRDGYNVRALVHYNSRGSWGNLDALEPDLREKLEVRLGDITDSFLVRDLVDGCDTVFHLAALIGIPYSYLAPSSYVHTNVHGTLNVLQAARQAKTRRLIVTSTSEVYGTAKYAPITEDHPLQGQSPYSASKIAADKLAESYFYSFDLPVVILRPFNTYGPRQSARAVIPTVLTQALSGFSEIALGNTEPTRDMTYVEDTVQAFVLASHASDIEGETIHFGQGEEISIGDLAQRCVTLTGSRAELVKFAERKRPEKSEVGRLICDASKAQRLLGWKPTISLDEGLHRTAEYLRLHMADYRKGYIV